MKGKTKPSEFTNDERGLDFYARVPESLIYDTLAPDHAARVYGMIDRHLNHKTQEAWPGTRAISKRLGISRSNVHKCLAYLEQERYLIITAGRDGNTNHYRLMAVRKKKTEGGGDLLEDHPRTSQRTPPVLSEDPPGPPGGPPPVLLEVHNQSVERAKNNQRTDLHEYPTNADIKDFTDWWVARFREKFKVPYDFKGSIDREGAKKILKIASKCEPPVDPREFVVWIQGNASYTGDRFLSSLVRSIAGIASRLNQFLPDYNRRGGSRVPQYESETVNG